MFTVREDKRLTLEPEVLVLANPECSALRVKLDQDRAPTEQRVEKTAREAEQSPARRAQILP